MDELTIKQVRLLNELSQKKMAISIDMPLSTYQKKERGESEFTLSEVRKICEKYGVDLNLIKG